MVLEVLSDAWEMVLRCNSCGAKLLSRAHPRQHQQLWGIDCTTAQDRLARCVGRQETLCGQILHSSSASVLDDDPRDQGMCHNRKVLTRLGWTEIGC
jgi:hypothetical protein